MGRNILAVIVSYIIIGIVVIGLFTGVYMIMGEDWAYKPGVFDVSTGWIAVMLVSAVIAALVGGVVCALISKHSKGAVLSLVAVIVVLGVLGVVMETMKPERTAEQMIRTPPTTVMDASTNSRQPLWIAVANPLIGVVGVMVGAMMVCPKLKKDAAG